MDAISEVLDDEKLKSDFTLKKDELAKELENGILTEAEYDLAIESLQEPIVFVTNMWSITSSFTTRTVILHFVDTF